MALKKRELSSSSVLQNVGFMTPHGYNSWISTSQRLIHNWIPLVVSVRCWLSEECWAYIKEVPEAAKRGRKKKQQLSTHAVTAVQTTANVGSCPRLLEYHYDTHSLTLNCSSICHACARQHRCQTASKYLRPETKNWSVFRLQIGQYVNGLPQRYTANAGQKWCISVLDSSCCFFN